MRSLKIVLLLSLAVVFNHCTSEKQAGLQAPTSFRDTLQYDTLHGVAIADPYRWLEEIESDATTSWINAQNDHTFGYLDQIPFRQAIKTRLSEIWNYERISSPMRQGDYYYFFKNDGLQNQAVLYRSKDLDDEPELVLDPNSLSEDGTSFISNLAFSGDKTKLAFQISEGGSDWRSIRILDLSTKELLGDVIEWVKFSGIAWTGDGFYYSRYLEPQPGEAFSGVNEFQQVYYHQVGTEQSADPIVFADRGRPNRGFIPETTTSERFLLLNVWESTSGNALYFRDQSIRNSPFSPIVNEIKRDFQFIDEVDGNFLIRTNFKADTWRLISVPHNRPQERFWKDILPAGPDVLSSVHLLHNRIVAVYQQNAHHRLFVFDLEGEAIGEIDLPGIGTVSNIEGSRDQAEAFFTFTSFTRPGTVYRLNLQTLTASVYRAPNINFNSDLFETKQVWYESMDGTRIPMFITHKKGLPLDGKRPTLLYGYGGFDISILPNFQAFRTILLENDGIFAVANIRGGGEFGKNWHLAGTKENKQNVFDDFQAAAEYLIDQKYTSSKKLAISGRSNGGLLVGACLTQRPELFRVAIPEVGVLDMLRYHKFTIGAAWASDYGRSDNAEDFDHLIAYSPYHNVLPSSYPATLITTADHDDRVFPAHSFKFAAELQHRQEGSAPVLIRIDTNAGHGAGKSTQKKLNEQVDLLSFMLYNMEEGVVYEY